MVGNEKVGLVENEFSSFSGQLLVIFTNFMIEG